MPRIVQRFVADQQGATAIEYALIASLVAIVIIQALTAMGSKLGNTLTKLGSTLKLN